MRVAIIVNHERKSSLPNDDEKLAETAALYAISYQFFICKPAEFKTVFQKIIDEKYDALIVGGGDGTVRAIAQLLIEQPIPLAILPLGTFNAFAKELSHGNDLTELFKMIHQHKIKMVDIGVVNHQVFLNHSSVGFYTQILKLRKKHKAILGKSKLLKILFAMFNLFHPLPIYQLQVKIDNQWLTLRTCFIFIGNNYHYTDIMHFGARESLNKGLLSIYILKCKTRWEIVKCILTTLFANFNKEKYLIEYTAEEITIDAQSSRLNIVIDGDLFQLENPVKYAILNKTLPVFAND